MTKKDHYDGGSLLNKRSFLLKSLINSSRLACDHITQKYPFAKNMIFKRWEKGVSHHAFD